MEQKKSDKPINLEPTEEELTNLSAACQAIWDLDENYLVPFEDYEIDLQGGKKSYQKEDRAADPLFKFVDEKVFQRKSYKSFIALLDNYEAETGVVEDFTPEEVKETKNFINIIMETNCMKYLHKYLQKQGKAEANVISFKKQIYKIWFELYKRETRNDSSGFEHVFLGEMRDDKVIGFHNWIQIYFQEKVGNLDYKGWILPKRRKGAHADGSDQLITIQFDWEGHDKSVSSSFIGTSPEFEFALYTLMFYCGKDENIIHVGDYDINIKCYKMYGKYLATCFPQAI